MLLEEDGQHLEAVKATRRLMHEVKNTVMDIRASSANGIRITDANIKKSISNLEKNQKEYCEQYYELIKKVYDERRQDSIK